MADPAIQVAETIQTASINPNPSPADINPPTASEKHPIVEKAPSEADSIPSDIVDPRRMIQPTTRGHTLPPLPDLRFEQSYLASLRGADTWGRVAWITIRDQVRINHNPIQGSSSCFVLFPFSLSSTTQNKKKKKKRRMEIHK